MTGTGRPEAAGPSRAHQSFLAAAARSGGPHDVQVAVGGTRALLRFVGSDLESMLMRALLHLRSPFEGPPDFVVHVWDGSTGAPNPVDVPPPSSELAAGSWVWSNDRGTRSAVQAGVPQLTVVDAERRLAWYWARSVDDIPLYEQASPLRLILAWLMPEFGCQLVHAAAVGRPSGGVLIAGRGGAGKSSSALACLASSLLYASDDYALVAPDETHVYSLYASGKLDATHAQRFSHLAAVGAHMSNNHPLDTDKAVFFLAERFAANVTRGFPLKALLVPRVNPAGTSARLTPIPGASALRALAPSTLLQMPGADPRALSGLALLARRLPAFTMEIGSDLQQIPAAIEELLDALGPPATG